MLAKSKVEMKIIIQKKYITLQFYTHATLIQLFNLCGFIFRLGTQQTSFAATTSTATIYTASSGTRQGMPIDNDNPVLFSLTN